MSVSTKRTYQVPPKSFVYIASIRKLLTKQQIESSFGNLSQAPPRSCFCRYSKYVYIVMILKLFFLEKKCLKLFSTSCWILFCVVFNFKMFFFVVEQKSREKVVVEEKAMQYAQLGLASVVAFHNGVKSFLESLSFNLST